MHEHIKKTIFNLLFFLSMAMVTVTMLVGLVVGMSEPIGFRYHIVHKVDKIYACRQNLCIVNVTDSERDTVFGDNIKDDTVYKSCVYNIEQGKSTCEPAFRAEIKFGYESEYNEAQAALNEWNKFNIINKMRTVLWMSQKYRLIVM